MSTQDFDPSVATPEHGNGSTLIVSEATGPETESTEPGPDSERTEKSEAFKVSQSEIEPKEASQTVPKEAPVTFFIGDSPESQVDLLTLVAHLTARLIQAERQLSLAIENCWARLVNQDMADFWEICCRPDNTATAEVQK